MRPEIKYGLLSSLLCTACLIFGYKFIGPNIILLVLLILVVCIVFAIRERKIKQMGFLELSDGMKTGLGVSVICAVIFSIGVYVYFHWIAPDVIESYATKLRTFLESKGTTAEEIEEQIEGLKPSYQARVSLSSLMLIGALISLIASLIMKRRMKAGM